MPFINPILYSFNSLYKTYPNFKYLGIAYIKIDEFQDSKTQALAFLKHIPDELLEDDFGWILLRCHKNPRYEIYNTDSLRFKKIEFNILNKSKFVECFDDVLTCLENEHKMDVSVNSSLYPDLNFVIIQ